MKTTNKACRKYVEQLLEFQGSNLSGYHHNSRYYVVVSYGWYAVFVYDKTNCVWYENASRYSMSTSKQMSQARPNNTVVIDKETLNQMLKDPNYALSA